jgi:hypothetical protein
VLCAFLLGAFAAGQRQQESCCCAQRAAPAEISLACPRYQFDPAAGSVQQEPVQSDSHIQMRLPAAYNLPRPVPRRRHSLPQSRTLRDLPDIP